MTDKVISPHYRFYNTKTTRNENSEDKRPSVRCPKCHRLFMTEAILRQDHMPVCNNGIPLETFLRKDILEYIYKQVGIKV
jgi:hypothetical protein